METSCAITDVTLLPGGRCALHALCIDAADNKHAQANITATAPRHRANKELSEVIGDIGPSLRLLADRIEGKISHAQAPLPLREKILSQIAARATEDRFTPQRLVHDVREVMPSNGILALDNGMCKIWFARNYRTQVANTILLDNDLATMGAGLPSAIMAARSGSWVRCSKKRLSMAACSW